MKNLFLNKKTIIITTLIIILIVAISVIFINSFRDNSITDNIDKIYVTNFPKLQYYVGEKEDFKGLKIAIVKKNGSTKYVEYKEENKDQFTFYGFNSSEETEKQTITVKYGECSTVFYISIAELSKPAPVLTEIKIDVLPKTEYKLGEWLNTDGGIILKKYSDGTTSRTIIINQYIDGWDDVTSGGVGTYTLTIKYKEGGVLKKTTYEITVTE